MLDPIFRTFLRFVLDSNFSLHSVSDESDYLKPPALLSAAAVGMVAARRSEPVMELRMKTAVRWFSVGISGGPLR
ncbi:unnamed protein product, partial [Vitis vinifera]|uniref:Uncharacterized protein n=1 Tax=Vitis vinifera TaxID=29760 RepID=D7TAI5_VITVI